MARLASIAAGVAIAVSPLFAQAPAATQQLVLQYSSYFGGPAWSSIAAVVVGADGFIYVAGSTRSRDFSVTPGAFQTQYGSDDGFGGHAFVSKFDPNNMTLVYSTYLGGSADETVVGLAVDAQGSAYVAGITNSPDFPRTPGAYGAPGGALFVAKLNPTGTSLMYSSTFLAKPEPTFGGALTAFAIDGQGNAYLAGQTASTDFPVTPGVVQSTLHASGLSAQNVFVMKLDGTGTNLVFSTYLGGDGTDVATGMAVAPGGEVWVVGNGGAGFPVTPDAMLASAPDRDSRWGFVAKLNSAATALIYSSYLPGVWPTAVALDRSGSAYVAGRVISGDVVLTPPFQYNPPPQPYSPSGVYYAKLTPGGAGFVYSAVLEPWWGSISGLAVDAGGDLYMAGDAGMFYPIFDGGLPSCNRDTLIDDSGRLQGGAFVAVADPAGRVISSSYFGGCRRNTISTVALDSSGSLYIAGDTESSDFPLTQSALQENYDSQIQTGDGTGFFSRVALTGDSFPRIQRIYDAASLYWGALAPGQLIVIDGTGLGPTQVVAGKFVNGILENNVGNTKVFFDDIPAPLFAVSESRIYAAVPFSVSGSWFGWGYWRRSFIQVVHSGVASANWGEYLDGRLPSFFTADSSGEGQALAFNADGTPNSPANPALRGSTVTLFISGAGPLNAPISDGQTMTSAVSFAPAYAYATVTNISCPIDFIGTVPGSVAELTQVRLSIPAGAPVGDEVPIFLNLDGFISQRGVFIAIK